MSSQVEDYLDRIRSAKGGARFSKLMLIAEEIAHIKPPEAGLRVLKAVFQRLDADRRAQLLLLKGFNRAKHPYVLAALQLADSIPEIRESADAYRRKYSFRSFAGDTEGLRAWNDRFASLRIEDAWRLSAEDFVRSLGGASADDAQSMLASIYGGLFATNIESMRALGVTEAMREAGLATIARSLFERPGLEAERSKLLAMVVTVDPSDGAARDFLLPILNSENPEDSDLLGAAARALGSPGRNWAAQPLADAMKAREHAPEVVTALAEAITKCAPASAVLLLADVMESTDSPSTRLSIGYALESLTGVRRSTQHDAAFWRQWWAANGRSAGHRDSERR